MNSLSDKEYNLLRHKASQYESIEDKLHATSFNSQEYIQLSREKKIYKEAYEVWTQLCELQSEIELYSNITEQTFTEKNAFKALISAREEHIALVKSVLYPTKTHSKNIKQKVILEIKAGTGGEEANHFNTDLTNMYIRYADLNKWALRIVNCNSNSRQWFTDIVMEISGDAVFEKLQFESGVHRVQRVPVTESSGRIHTSTSIVHVIPFDMLHTEDIVEEIPQSDLRIDTFRSSGAGGQHVNKTDSAVRIVHIPTGIKSECQSDRSQHRNKAVAMEHIHAKLAHLRQEEKQRIISEIKSEQGKSGDRHDKCRTYNFVQKRITDHRISTSFFNFHEFMNGSLDKIVMLLATGLKSQDANS